MLSTSECATFTEHEATRVISFWRFYLIESAELPIPVIRRIILKVLSIPIGSSEAERGFSIMNHIKTKRRSSLSAPYLEAMMRIRNNGPDELEEIRAMEYARKFAEAHSLVDSIAKPNKGSLNSNENLDVKFFPRIPFF